MSICDGHYVWDLIIYFRNNGKVQMTYDQNLHPQKRRLLRDLLMSVIGRLMEIKLVRFILQKISTMAP
jgi:hypothetical protein